MTVGLDGGYVHASDQKSRTEGWFEVIAGKSVQTEGGAKVFAFVNKYDTKPKRRLYEVLKSQGLQMNQQVVFLSDGGDTGVSGAVERLWKAQHNRSYGKFYVMRSRLTVGRRRHRFHRVSSDHFALIRFS